VEALAGQQIRQMESQDMALQQSKLSKQRSRMRRAANRYRGLQPAKCGMCGAPVIPHRVCGKCGHYKGRQVVSVTAE
jgi:large subunit ribosomal protein L32